MASASASTSAIGELALARHHRDGVRSERRRMRRKSRTAIRRGRDRAGRGRAGWILRPRTRSRAVAVREKLRLSQDATYLSLSFNRAGSFYGMEKRRSSTFRSGGMRAGAQKTPRARAGFPEPATPMRQIRILSVSHEWMVNESMTASARMSFPPVIQCKNGRDEAGAPRTVSEILHALPNSAQGGQMVGRQAPGP